MEKVGIVVEFKPNHHQWESSSQKEKKTSKGKENADFFVKGSCCLIQVNLPITVLCDTVGR